jgi:hypothetical protein
MSGSAGASPEVVDPFVRDLQLLYTETERTLREFFGKIRAWLKVSRSQPPAGAPLPLQERAAGVEMPIQPLPEEDKSPEEIQDVSDAQPKEDSPEADVPLPCFVYMVGLGASLVSRAREDCESPGAGQTQRPRRFRTKENTDA